MHHHIFEGVDHFLLIDNNSEGSSKGRAGSSSSEAAARVAEGSDTAAAGMAATGMMAAAASTEQEPDDEACELRSLIRAGVVTLVRDGTAHAQAEVLQRHIAPFVRAPARSRWVLNIDVDEFVYAREAGRLPSATIWQFLERQAPSVRAVYLPWKMFGVSGSVAPAGKTSLHTVRC